MRPSARTTAWLLALFLGALTASIRVAGTSPIVWIDTFNDEHEIQRCLQADSCTRTGMSTSVPGQAHAVAWLEWRALLAWLGIGLDGTHVAIQVSNALAVLLVFSLATALGGPVAGTLAAWLAIDRLDTFVRATALYNTSPLLFLGAVLVLICTAVVVRPGLASVTLAALVAAVMANVHLACAMTGASVVWVALLAPRRRIALAVCAALVFALATFAMAPPTWLHNVGSLLQDGSGRGHLVALDVPRNPMMSWALFAVAAWLASFAIRAPAAVAYRRRAHAALAVLVPSLAVFLVAPRFGFNPEAKYIFHLKAACAVAAALPIAAIVSPILRPRLQYLLPFALALALASSGRLAARAGVTAVDERTPTVADVTAVARILQGEHGWTAEEMLRNVKTPFGITLLSGLRQIATPTDAQSAATDSSATAVVLVLEAADVPEPLPAGWRIVRRTARSATVLVRMRARIDWREMVVCAHPADGASPRCERTTWQPDAELFVTGLPPGGAGWQGRLRVTLALRPGPPGFVDEIFMPRMLFLCGGRITSIPHGMLSTDQRHARLTIPDTIEMERPLVTLEWEIGAAECKDLAYDGMIPFFVEGDAAAAQAVTAVLRAREAIP